MTKASYVFKSELFDAFGIAHVLLIFYKRGIPSGFKGEIFSGRGLRIF